jgi:7-keto-8-aminopelargonate synthetase-like enzyme
MILLNSEAGNYVESGGKSYSYFGGNNYLGLANHSLIKEASIQAIKKYGVNIAASRRTTGTTDIHLELENDLSVFKGTEDSVTFASGYQGNRILLEILKEKYSAVYIDEYAHPSITDSIPGSIKKVFTYKHCDPLHLESLLDNNKGLRPLIITDGIFPLTGEIAPLDKIYPQALKHQAIIVIDDAHSTGILGKNGRGTQEYFDLPQSGNTFQSETMSKALGAYGGFISGSREMINTIRENSKAYQSSTALPPPVVAAGIMALKILKANPDLCTRLHENAETIRSEIIRLGYQTTHYNTPIIPLMLSSQHHAKALSLFLEDSGIIVPFMDYPVKQEKYILRIAVSALHTARQIEILIENLDKWKNKYGTN